MKLTRRGFVRLSGMAAVSVSVLGAAGNVFGQIFADDGLYRVPVNSTADPLNYLVRAHFEPFTGTVFRTDSGDGNTFDLRLKSVTDLTKAVNAKRGYSGESFSLLFESASRKRMAAGGYTFDHDNLGKFTLTLLQVGKACKNYEAVINRIGR
jgi:hypothetical protein